MQNNQLQQVQNNRSTQEEQADKSENRPRLCRRKTIVTEITKNHSKDCNHQTADYFLDEGECTGTDGTCGNTGLLFAVKQRIADHTINQ